MGFLTECRRGGGFGAATRTIKQIFGDLGKRLGYEVAAAGYKRADEREWLYDMVWYRVTSGLMSYQFWLWSQNGSKGCWLEIMLK